MSANKGYLVLENGVIFEGEYFGTKGEVTGEIVFTTGMTGYLETLTDPSYHGQIVLQTFPLIGNYGVIPEDFESESVGAKAYIVKYLCKDPSNFRCQDMLGSFLSSKNIVGLCNIDTRALTKIIRENGVMNGIITDNPQNIDKEKVKQYTIVEAVKNVSIKQAELYEVENAQRKVALLDFGYKKNILRELMNRGCEVKVFPHNATIEQIKEYKADGIMLSNGPGDPAENTEVIANIKEMMASNTPIFGICLGHQLLALASGFKTEKMKYGHRGANQPVKDLETQRVYITSQNHGYAVVNDSIGEEIGELWFENVNDKTCEGIKYKNVPVCSVQFHPEASGGPLDTTFLFDKFIESMEGNK